MLRLLAVVFLISLALPFRMQGALADTSRMPTEWLASLPKDPAFRYAQRVQSRSFFDQIVERLGDILERLINGAARTSTGVFLFIAGMLVLIVAMFVVSRRAGGSPWRVGGARAVLAGSSTVEDLTEDDLDRRIGEAEAAGDYRAAVRYHFLQLLRELQDAGYIEWRAERTNREYLRALASTPLVSDFSQVLRVFEKTWYGEQQVDSGDYAHVAPQFSMLRQTVRRGR